MTSKKATEVLNKTRITGKVNVGIDGNMLRLQFPSKVSQAIWGKPQKYKSLGLFNTPENRRKAEDIALIAQMDLLQDNFDISLEKYSPFLLEKTIEKIEPDFPKVLELCTKHYKVKKEQNVEVATQQNHKYYLNSMQECANYDIIKDAVKIRDSIRKVRTAPQTKTILSFIYETVRWAQRNELMPKNVVNPYKELQEDVVGKPNRQKPKHIQEISEEENDNSYRGFSYKEAVAVVEKFSCHEERQVVYKDFVAFLFLTGCRTGEAIGLRWQDINEDCSEINFCHSFCRHSKKLKPLKTARHGKTSRKFPCGENLKELLLNLRNSQAENLSPKSFVFSLNGNPINHVNFYHVWTGRNDRRDSVIVDLMKQGKIKVYLKPYATRHTFITLQLKAGVTPANVAKLVGNSPEMIYKHYVSADEDARVMIETPIFN
jgi:integrase